MLGFDGVWRLNNLVLFEPIDSQGMRGAETSTDGRANTFSENNKIRTIVCHGLVLFSSPRARSRSLRAFFFLLLFCPLPSADSVTLIHFLCTHVIADLYVKLFVCAFGGVLFSLSEFVSNVSHNRFVATRLELVYLFNAVRCGAQ